METQLTATRRRLPFEQEALICAKASEAIYGILGDPRGSSTSKAVMESIGFNSFLWIDLPTIIRDVCAFLATSENYHLLVFRGTKTPQDWLTDAMCKAIRFDIAFSTETNIGEVHSGFARCLGDGLSRILLPLAHRDAGKPLLVTGHSLGGALAALSCLCFSTQKTILPPLAAVYTFGQPRIGMQPFCEEYQKCLGGKLFRFINNKDVVPQSPVRVMGYADEGAIIHFDSAGKPLLESIEWQSFLGRAFGSISDITEFVGHLQTDLGDHSITKYRTLVEFNQRSLGTIFESLKLAQV